MRRKCRKILYTGVMTGRETEGDLAGEIVCPKIVLWALDKRTNRRNKVLGHIRHDTKVNILDECKGPAEEVLYLVQSQERRKTEGWVTERFVLLDEGD